MEAQQVIEEKFFQGELPPLFRNNSFKTDKTYEKQGEIELNTTQDESSEEAEPLQIDLTDDLYCGNHSSEFVGDFVCMLCCGIVFKPIKCDQCGTLICASCVNPRVIDGTKKFICFKRCGGKTFTEFKNFHPMEKKVMNGLLFRCQHEECQEQIPYGKYFAHLRTKCTVKKHKKLQIPEGAFAKP